MQYMVYTYRYVFHCLLLLMLLCVVMHHRCSPFLSLLPSPHYGCACPGGGGAVRHRHAKGWGRQAGLLHVWDALWCDVYRVMSHVVLLFFVSVDSWLTFRDLCMFAMVDARAHEAAGCDSNQQATGTAGSRCNEATGGSSSSSNPESTALVWEAAMLLKREGDQH